MKKYPKWATGIALVMAASLSACGKEGKNAPASDHGPSEEVARLPAPTLREIFNRASAEFGVPVGLLKSIGYVESRWNHLDPHPGSTHVEQKGNYGIMGLNDDESTNHTLQQAATLLKLPVQKLITDPESNIRGAAAVLREIARKKVGGDNPDLELRGWAKLPLKWADAVRDYSGLHAEAAGYYLEDVYTFLMKGRRPSLDDRYPLIIEQEPSITRIPPEWTGTSPHPTPPNPTPPGPTIPPTHPSEPPPTEPPHPAPAPTPLRIERFPAALNNFTANSSFNPKFIVIHDTEGKFAGALDVLRFGEPGRMRSANYLIRSSDGLIAEIVNPGIGYAWHAAGWNRLTIGIEHEAKSMLQPGWYTRVMYENSYRLVKQLADKYRIPMDSEHVFGHEFWSMVEYLGSPLQKKLVDSHLSQKQTHDDPGPLWRWDLYFDALKGDRKAFERLATPISKIFHKR